MTADESPEIEGPATAERMIPPAWQESWQACPEGLKNELWSLIEHGRLAPELFNELGIHFEETTDRAKMGPGYRDPEADAIAQADYRSRVVRFLAPAKAYDLDQRSHILNHEVGHFAAKYVDLNAYADLIRQRVFRTNGPYVCEVISVQSPFGLHEMLADDLADYFRASSAEDMLANRLRRAGPQQLLTSLSENEKKNIYTEAKALWRFFAQALDPQSQREHDWQTNWLNFDDLTDESIFNTPASLAEIFQPPSKKPSPQKQPFDFFAWLISPG